MKPKTNLENLKNQGNLENKENPSLLEKLKERSIKEIPSQSSNLVEILEQLFNETNDYITSSIIQSETKYSLVRINNVLREMCSKKFLVRTRNKGKFYYKRNIVE